MGLSFHFPSSQFVSVLLGCQSFYLSADCLFTFYHDWVSRAGVTIGRVFQTWNFNGPGYSLSALCKKHVCSKIISHKLGPTIDGGMRWLAHGLDTNTTKEQHMACFKEMITPSAP